VRTREFPPAQCRTPRMCFRMQAIAGNAPAVEAQIPHVHQVEGSGVGLRPDLHSSLFLFLFSSFFFFSFLHMPDTCIRSVFTRCAFAQCLNRAGLRRGWYPFSGFDLILDA
jgi:hypothetical protein